MDRLKKNNYFRNSSRPSLKRNAISNQKIKTTNKNIISSDRYLNLPYQTKDSHNNIKQVKNF